jgi:DNA (cytosine-5)-methyltransferase 1
VRRATTVSLDLAGIDLYDYPMPAVKRFRLVDLFAGCGGLTQGFVQAASYRPLAAVEHNKFAAATYAVNFGADHMYRGDITEWVKGRLPSADVVIGGPPCQGFSNLGNKQDDDKRNELWSAFVDAIVKIKPKAFLIENVDRFITSPQFADLQRELAPGRRLADYAIDAGLLLASDFGAAQLRKRAIVIGTRKDLQQIFLPQPSGADRPWKTTKEALKKVNPAVPRDRTDLPAGRTVELFGGVPGPYSMRDLHITRNYTQLSLDRFEHIPYGGNRFNLPESLKADCWKRHTTGSGDVMGRLRWDRPSVTVRTEFFKPEKGRYLHPDEPRALTHLEAAKLQGFPDGFKWCGSKLEIARQIGNAVPVELAEALARHIAEALA